MNIIEEINYKPLLKECFQTDQQLLDIWHICAGKGLDVCVDQTYNDLQYCKVKVFRLEVDGKLIGYFGEENYNYNKYLTGFFIKPEFRIKEILDKFWQIILIHFRKQPFLCGLYTKNIPANKFIQKHNGQVIFNGEIEHGNIRLYKVGV